MNRKLLWKCLMCAREITTRQDIVAVRCVCRSHSRMCVTGYLETGPLLVVMRDD